MSKLLQKREELNAQREKISNLERYYSAKLAALANEKMSLRQKMQMSASFTGLTRNYDKLEEQNNRIKAISEQQELLKREKNRKDTARACKIAKD